MAWKLTLALSCAPLLLAQPAAAQSTDQRIADIEAQIKALQGQLQQVTRALHEAQAKLQPQQQAQQAPRARAPTLRSNVAQTPAETNPPLVAAAPPSPPSASPEIAVAQTVPDEPKLPLGTFRIGGVTVQLGGFIEAAGIFRSRNEVADISSSFSGIPEGNSVENHEAEFRATARQSRLSLLVQGKPSTAETVGAYFETDFQGVGTTSNSNESNSYVPRLRQAYATYDNTDWGFHILGGQAWSLLTMSKTGDVPRQENIPLTIDAQYVAGFNWARQAQLRLTKDFADHRVWLAASLEEPQSVYSIGPNGAGTVGGTVNDANPGGSGLNASTNYSDDIAPDIVLKAAFDPGYGHYEAYGLARFFHDRVDAVGNGTSNTRIGGGGGVAALIPIVPNLLDFQISGLAGVGIGRYGSGQLPDATLSQSGRPVPLPEITALAGLVGHPISDIDLYGYAGTEQVLSREDFSSKGLGYGYGSPLYNNSGCGIELSTAGCVANTSGLVEGTVGAWWRFLHGNYGTMQVGAQYAYVKRDIFSGIGGGKGADDNMALVSFRYIPFQ
jgi:hypothetical protein